MGGNKFSRFHDSYVFAISGLYDDHWSVLLQKD